jgi:hypothetical protein
MFAHSTGHTTFAFVALVLLPACVSSVQGSVNPAEFAALHRVVVLPFAVPDGAPETLSVGFADEVSSHLSGARFAVVDPASVVNAMTDQEIRGTDLADPRVAVRVGQLMGADAVLLGRVVSRSDATAAASFCAQEMTCLRGKVMTAVGKFVALGGAS